jgi:hypothetical protein
MFIKYIFFRKNFVCPIDKQSYGRYNEIKAGKLNTKLLENLMEYL